MRYFLLISFLYLNFSTSQALAQKKLSEADRQVLVEFEDSLIVVADSMLRMPIPDDRLDYGFKFARILQEAIAIEGSYQYPFAKLEQVIQILKTDDQSFRMFNWLVAPSDNIRRYYGIIQMSDGRLYPLINFSDRLNDKLLTTTLDRKHWYGCEYYKVKEAVSGKDKYYCLFGVNRDGAYSNKKVLDVLTFTEHGPQFGAPIFLVPNENETRLQTQSRVIWEYKKTAQFSLNFDDSRNMIMFDRLQSEINNPSRKNTFIPMGQTDGLKWDKRQWVFVKEAIPILKLKEGEAPIDGVLPGSRK